MTLDPGWRPLLTGAQARSAWELVDGVARELRELGAAGADTRPLGPSVSGGAAGIALFFSYLDLAQPDRGHDETAFDFLESAIDGLGRPDLLPSLYAGFTGVAWAVEHIQDLYGEGEGEDDDPDDDPDDSDDLNAEIDQALLPLLATSPWPWDYELIRGLAGYGLYAVDRLPAPSGAELLRQVVDRLAELVEERPEGTVTWHTPHHLIPGTAAAHLPEGQYNLGLSHGVPGVIALLAEIVARPAAVEALGTERSEQVGRLLAGSVAWLLDQRLGGRDAPTLYPAFVAPGEAPMPTRTAWCYGDPGVASVLLKVARVLGDDSLEAEAIDTARRSFDRPVDRMGLADACLCHGSSGLLHLANRFWQATGSPEFRDRALEWTVDTFARHQPGEGFAGFRNWHPGPPEAGWLDTAGLLTGSTGVALTLLAAVSDVEPCWDRLLMVDLPVGAAGR
jgi:lantibiotic modifying enzyme